MNKIYSNYMLSGKNEETLIELAYSAYTLGILNPENKLESILLSLWGKILQVDCQRESLQSIANTISKIWVDSELSLIDKKRVVELREKVDVVSKMVNHRAFLGMPEPGNKKVSRRKFDQFLKKRRNEFIENKNQPSILRRERDCIEWAIKN